MTTTTSQTNQRRFRTGSGALVLDALKVIWLPWILARVLVGGALGLSRYEISHLGVSTPKAIAASHAGLLGWDASWCIDLRDAILGRIGIKSNERARSEGKV